MTGVPVSPVERHPDPTVAEDVRWSIARVRCDDWPPISRPCGGCLRAIEVELERVPAHLVDLTARESIRLDGNEGEPTPLRLSGALSLLQAIMPAIIREAEDA